MIVASLCRMIRLRLVGALALLVAGWAAVFASPAECSEQSKLLLFRGLSEFNAGRYQTAADLFRAAVSEDGEDVEARFYYGVTRSRLGEHEEAIDDLAWVIEKRPAFIQANLELGVAMVYAGRCGDTEAKKWLEVARGELSTRSAAAFFLGVCNVREREVSSARRNLEEAREDERFATAATFYLGLAHYHAREWSEASRHFQRTIERLPGSAIAAEARTYLRIMAISRKRTRPYVEIGVEYDSNLSLVPKDESRAMDEADGRVTLSAGGTYRLWSWDSAQLTAGYEFFQSLHFDLTDFNLQTHTPRIQFAGSWNGLRFGVLGAYDFYLLDGSRLLQQPVVTPWLRVPLSASSDLEVYYRFRWRDYFQDRFSAELDALRHSAGLRFSHAWAAPEVRWWAGYQFDRNGAVHPRGRAFAYHRNEVGGGFSYALGFVPAVLGLSYRVHWEDYDSPSDGRDDLRNTIEATVRRKISDRFEVTGGYQAILNDSDKSRFKYDRHIVSAAVNVSF